MKWGGEFVRTSNPPAKPRPPEAIKRGGGACLPRTRFRTLVAHIAKTRPEAHGNPDPGHKPRHLADSASHERRSAGTRHAPGTATRMRALEQLRTRPPTYSVAAAPSTAPARARSGSGGLGVSSRRRSTHREASLSQTASYCWGAGRVAHCCSGQLDTGFEVASPAYRSQ